MLQVGLAVGNRPAEEGHIGRQVEVVRCTPTLTSTAHVYSDSTSALWAGSGGGPAPYFRPTVQCEIRRLLGDS